MPRFHQIMIAAVALAIVAGCNPRVDDYYDLPPAIAFQKLAHADIVGFRDARQCGMLIYFAKTESAPKTITWVVTSGGIRALYFTIVLTPSGRGTVITVDVPNTADGGEFYDSEQEYHHPLLLQPLRPALRELIDSAIQSRPYDWQQIKGPLNSIGTCSKSTKVSVSCGKAGDDVYTSNRNGKLRAKVIEAVDATLTGRGYNPDKGEEGSTAWRWPNDTVVHATDAQMAADTMKQPAGLYKQLPARMAEAARDEQAQAERQREYEQQHPQGTTGANQPMQASGSNP